MKRYLLDTGIAADFINDRHGIRHRVNLERRLGHRIGIAIPILGELWAGVEFSTSRERNLARLQYGIKQFRVWPFSHDAAVEYGRIFAELKRQSRTIQQIDMQIAAIARTLPHCIIVTKDSDLSVVSGVIVENWAA